MIKPVDLYGLFLLRGGGGRLRGYQEVRGERGKGLKGMAELNF